MGGGGGDPISLEKDALIVSTSLLFNFTHFLQFDISSVLETVTF